MGSLLREWRLELGGWSVKHYTLERCSLLSVLAKSGARATTGF